MASKRRFMILKRHLSFFAKDIHLTKYERTHSLPRKLHYFLRKWYQESVLEELKLHITQIFLTKRKSNSLQLSYLYFPMAQIIFHFAELTAL